MSRKKNLNPEPSVPHAEQPSTDTVSAPVQAAPVDNAPQTGPQPIPQETKPNAAPSQPPVVSIRNIAKSLTEAQIQTAESLGIPVRQLLQWGFAVEQEVLAQHELWIRSGAQFGQTQQPQPSQQIQPAQGAPASNPLAFLGQLGPVLQQLGLGGGGGQSNAFFEAFQTKVLDRALASMDSDAAIGKAIKDQIVAKLAGEVVSKAVA